MKKDKRFSGAKYKFKEGNQFMIAARFDEKLYKNLIKFSKKYNKSAAAMIRECVKSALG